jgi:hypothetical protein
VSRIRGHPPHLARRWPPCTTEYEAGPLAHNDGACALRDELSSASVLGRQRSRLPTGRMPWAPVLPCLRRSALANFAVRLGPGPGWDSSRQIRDQDGWDEHAVFMDGLVDEGFIILGGPVGDGEQTLHVVRAADEDQIRAHLDRDPWASAGLLRETPRPQIYPFRRWEDQPVSSARR